MTTPRNHSAPSWGEFLEEVMNLVVGFVVVSLPFMILFLPGIVLFVVAPAIVIGAVLVVLGLIAAILVGPPLLVMRLVRRRRRHIPEGRLVPQVWPR
jgi:hypothetical protein